MSSFLAFFRFLSPLSSNLVIASMVCLLIGIFHFQKFSDSKRNYLLFFVAIVLFGSAFALIDPHLNLWDEQYHALVAKNLSDNPFKPVLFTNNPFPLDHTSWIQNEVWLHKQPLSLWQIALSIKVFGNTLWAVRFPSIILHALTSIVLISIAKRFLNSRLAVLTGILFGFSFYMCDFISGHFGMDHNDVSFVFYVTASIWAYLKYQEASQKRKWIIWVGIFTGCAVLTKWLVGLSLFAGWGAVIVFTDVKNSNQWKHIFSSFFISLLVFVPWQLYCYVRFPKEFLYEMAFNSKHFTEVIEGHEGKWDYYLDLIRPMYGNFIYTNVLLYLGLLFCIYLIIKNQKKWILPLAIFLVVHLFFMLAATKLPGYITIVAPLGFLFILLPFHVIGKRLNLKTPLIISTLFFLGILTGFNTVQDRHGDYRTKDYYLETKYCLEKLEKTPKNTIVFIQNQTINIVPSLRFFSSKRAYIYQLDFIEVCNSKKLKYKIIDCSSRP